VKADTDSEYTYGYAIHAVCRVVGVDPMTVTAERLVQISAYLDEIGRTAFAGGLSLAQAEWMLKNRGEFLPEQDIVG
jgi:hypothetical protein